MKRFNLLFNAFFVALVLTITSCNEKHKAETVTILNVELNQGEKWVANPETTQGIENMKVLVNQLNKDTEIKDYQKLGKELENEFTTIFKKCTMEGEAHNQLHNYLIPLKDYIKNLQSNTLEECNKTHQNIKNHLAAYSSYFK